MQSVDGGMGRAIGKIELRSFESFGIARIDQSCACISAVAIGERNWLRNLTRPRRDRIGFLSLAVVEIEKWARGGELLPLEKQRRLSRSASNNESVVISPITAGAGQRLMRSPSVSPNWPIDRDSEGS